MNRKPYTVQILERGTWRSDITSNQRWRVFDRLLWLTRSPRRKAIARVVDRDGRMVTPS